MNSIYKKMDKIDDTRSLNEKWNVKNQRELKKLKESMNENELTQMITTYINDKYSQYNPYIDVRYSAIVVTFMQGVNMNLVEPYDDEFLIEFEEDLSEKFADEAELSCEMVNHDEILVNIETKQEVDNEPYVSYKTGKYAKDLKRPDNGYIVYNNGVYIGYADSPKEAELMISHDNTRTRKLQESTKYEYEVYMDSNSSDEDEFFTDLRLAKKFAKYLAKRYCPQDPGSCAVIRRGPRGGDPNIQEWPIIAKIKDD